MELIACHCNWDIPGVDALPSHSHPWSPNDRSHVEHRTSASGRPSVVIVTDQDPDKEPHVWVNWKTVAREVARG